MNVYISNPLWHIYFRSNVVKWLWNPIKVFLTVVGGRGCSCICNEYLILFLGEGGIWKGFICFFIEIKENYSKLRLVLNHEIVISFFIFLKVEKKILKLKWDFCEKNLNFEFKLISISLVRQWNPHTPWIWRFPAARLCHRGCWSLAALPEVSSRPRCEGGTGSAHCCSRGGVPAETAPI